MPRSIRSTYTCRPDTCLRRMERHPSRQAGVELTFTTPEPEAALALLVAGETDLAMVHSYSNVPRELPNGGGGGTACNRADLAGDLIR